jgi:hypothetical protein
MGGIEAGQLSAVFGRFILYWNPFLSRGVPYRAALRGTILNKCLSLVIK